MGLLFILLYAGFLALSPYFGPSQAEQEQAREMWRQKAAQARADRAHEFEELKVPASQGDLQAIMRMGHIRWRQGRREEALALWRRVAGEDDLSAISRLADALRWEKQYPEAIYWLERGAKLGKASSQQALGISLLEGKHIAKDEKAACHWLTAAVQQKEKYAYLPLARLYAEGRGCERDLVEAYALAAIGEDVPPESMWDGPEESASLKAELAWKMTSEEISRARKRLLATRPDIARQKAKRIRRQLAVRCALGAIPGLPACVTLATHNVPYES